MDPYLTTYPKTRRQQTEIDPFSPAQTPQFNAGPAFPPALANATASGLNPASATRYAVLRSQLESSAGQQAMLSALPPKTAADYPQGGQTGTITYQGPEGWNNPGKQFKLTSFHAGGGGPMTFDSPTPTMSPEAQAGRANADRVKRLATLGERANIATDQLYGPGYRPAVEAQNQRLATEKAAVDAAAADAAAKNGFMERRTRVEEAGVVQKDKELANAAAAQLQRTEAAERERKDRLEFNSKELAFRQSQADAAAAASKAAEARSMASAGDVQKQLKTANDQLALWRQKSTLDPRDPKQAMEIKKIDYKLSQFANPISTSPVGGPPAPLPSAPSISAPAQAAPVAGSTASTAGPASASASPSAGFHVPPNLEQYASVRMSQLLEYMTPEQAKEKLQSDIERLSLLDPEQAKRQIAYDTAYGRGPTGRYLGDGPD